MNCSAFCKILLKNYDKQKYNYLPKAARQSFAAFVKRFQAEQKKKKEKPKLKLPIYEMGSNEPVRYIVVDDNLVSNPCQEILTSDTATNGTFWIETTSSVSPTDTTATAGDWVW